MIRFLIPRRDRLPADAAERCSFAGLDEVPCPIRAQWSGELLLIHRDGSDSGALYVPWRVDGLGEPVLHTGSLMQRDEPYLLPLELARGTLCRLRGLVGEWQSSGGGVPEQALAAAADAGRALAQAATAAEPSTAAAEAEAAIALAQRAVAALQPGFAQLAHDVRSRQAGRAVTLVGVQLAGPIDSALAAPLAAAFNCAVAPLDWRQIESAEGKRDWSLADRHFEFCHGLGWRICAGPLLKLDRASVPDWLCLWEGDAESIASLAMEFLRAAVARYRGQAAVWLCGARLNVHNVLSLSEQTRLRLAVLAIETLRCQDRQTPIALLVDQPWAGFMGSQRCDFAPLHFADALARAELGLSAVGLELNVGYFPEGSQPCDALELSRLLDRFALLGLPLVVSLCVPGAAGADPRAQTATAPVGEASPQSQAAWLERYLPVLLSKPAVQAILWNGLTDAAAHDFPHSGLVDAEGRPRPALAKLAELRARYQW